MPKGNVDLFNNDYVASIHIDITDIKQSKADVTAAFKVIHDENGIDSSRYWFISNYVTSNIII